jgi:hypothetical protein
VTDVSAPATDELFCEENPPVPLTNEDLVELHALIPRVYAGHQITPQHAVNRYLAFVGAGLAELAHFLAGQPQRRER